MNSNRRTNRRIVVVISVVLLLGAGATIALYLVSREGGGPGPGHLPPGCARPSGGFLVVASNTGYNDSIGHGAPTKSWPIITVHKGQNVTIVVCNTDVQAHGFQITHYVNNQETLVPGQVLRVSFIADQTGSFIIYCDIFCSIHIYMQNGLLNVTP